jgi:hypothetical protein
MFRNVLSVSAVSCGNFIIFSLSFTPHSLICDSPSGILSVIRKKTLTLEGIFVEDEHILCLSFTYGTPFCVIRLRRADRYTDRKTRGFCYSTAVAQWLRCCATNQKVAVSFPGGVMEIFH